MFFCIVLSILLFILSVFEMKKVTQPKFRVLDVEIVENELKFNNKNNKYEYVYDTVFKYMDEDNEKYVRLVVEDTGTGIPREIQQKVFHITEFFRKNISSAKILDILVGKVQLMTAFGRK